MHARRNSRRARDSLPKKAKRKQKGKGNSGAKFRQVGNAGQEIVKNLFPMLKFIDQPSADFVFLAKGRPALYFEVKTTFQEPVVAGKKFLGRILLKTRNGEWINNKAHYVIFVTRNSAYIGKASDIRAFVKMQASFLKTFKRSDRLVDTFVPIKDLLERKLVFGFSNKNPEEARIVFKEFMNEQHRQALEQERVRKELFRKAIEGEKRHRRNIVLPQKPMRSNNHFRHPIRQPSRRGN